MFILMMLEIRFNFVCFLMLTSIL